MKSEYKMTETYSKSSVSLESEQRVIGALLVDPEALDSVTDILQASDFYDLRHRLIYSAIMDLSIGHQLIDHVTVMQWLEDRGYLQEAGGQTYPARLYGESASSAGIQTYANTVKDKSLIRQLIQASTETLEAAKVPESKDATILIDEAQARLFALTNSRGGESYFVKAVDGINEVINKIQEANAKKSSITGLPTGFDDLDKKTSGLHPGELIIIAARPSMGKTSFAMNIAEYVAQLPDKNVGFFSLEMPTVELLTRSLSSLSRVPQNRLRNGNLQEKDWSLISNALPCFRDNFNMFISDRTDLNPVTIRSRARKLKHDVGLDLLVVDYLQLMSGSQGFNGMNRTQEISEISRSLKLLAKELEIPVIALSQLNRGVDSRSDKRPILSDLRESGAIEQDADVILFLYREEVYEKEKEEIKGIAEVIIGKQRNGPIGTVRMTFNGELTRFDNYAGPDDF